MCKVGRSFTLLELIIVVVVIGIIAGFAIPGYFGVKGRADQRAAVTQLTLIHTAEKVRHLESGKYRDCAGYIACNDPDPAIGLNLDLPNDGWVYTVICEGGDCDTATNFTATAEKGDCTYTMTKDTSADSGCVFSPY